MKKVDDIGELNGDGFMMNGGSSGYFIFGCKLN
jgi:hypothetical protein